MATTTQTEFDKCSVKGLEYEYLEDSPDYWQAFIFDPTSSEGDIRAGLWESVDKNLKEFHYTNVAGDQYCYGEFKDGFLNIISSTPPDCFAEYYG